jgi:broad specificity phosphatase PhoE
VPLAKALDLPIYLDEGIGEWYGLLHHPSSPDHPVPLDVDKWPKYFPEVEFRRGETEILGNRRGESMTGVHERARKALDVIIRQADNDGLNSIILCTHAATNIALGRALIGDPQVFIRLSRSLRIGGSTDRYSIFRRIYSGHQECKGMEVCSEWRYLIPLRGRRTELVVRWRYPG